MRKVFLILGVLLIVAAGFVGYHQRGQMASELSIPVNPMASSPTPTPIVIKSFKECVAARNPVLDSYPPQCQTEDGKLFTQDVDYIQQYKDLIDVVNPQPNQVATSPLRIEGQARGSWYSEGTFSIELVDINGTRLARANARADGEWMTEDFVPFKADITFRQPITKRGELIIRNANPSGLKETAKEVIVPVLFQEN